ncbi:MAG: hypothetical protein F4Y07_07915 [Gemmatimonadetes bacterium]|nr:hypothetical protein [Gemmatimonadota bacterium]MYE16392.1 hypothetical protein [Gemmatimonadota bacterium]
MSGSGPAETRQDVRYQPDDRPPLPITVGLGLQYAMLCIASIVLTPMIMITLAGGSDEYLSWAVFAALVISGLTTAIQARKLGRIGAGYILVMGSTSAFLAVSVTAIERGGPGMLATLIIAAALVQFVLAARMALLRKVFTPTVAGTVLILIPITLTPLILRKLAEVPADASPLAGPVTAGVTLLVTLLVPLRFSGVLRLWAPALGIVAGCLVAALGFGIYDMTTVAEAAWIGLPDLAYPGIDLSFRPEFWALLPSFIMVTLVGAMDTLGDAIAIQRVSWRKPRAIDFRSIQGAIGADGVGNLLSGLAGTVPNTTYGMSIAVAELTGVAARRIGICVGAVFIVLAFLPKFVTLIVAIPGPVVAAYYVILVALIFVFGMKILLSEGLDYRKGLVVGVAFWLGIAFQFGWIYPEYLQGAWGELLGNGMTVGGLTVILLTVFGEIGGGGRSRLKTRLTAATWPEVDAFLTRFAARKRWGEEMETRLRAVGEETMQILTSGDAEETADGERRLLLIARSDGNAADLEFIATTDATNIEDQLAMLSEATASVPVETETPLRLLRHYASSIRHQQYHDIDILTIRVDAVGRAGQVGWD